METYRRVLLKISGEVLGGTESLDGKALDTICDDIITLAQQRVEIALVVGGGNIFRGIVGVEKGVDRVMGDYMGMLATLINGIALVDTLRKKGAKVAIQSSIPIEGVVQHIDIEAAKALLESGTIVVFAGGTGLPFFSTDSNAALRAAEIHADILLKATKVDGVYDKDPKKFPDAKKFQKLSYDEAINKNLKVMDSTAFSLCRDNKIPLLVFKLEKGTIPTVLQNMARYTLLSDFFS
ncbi:MAG: UMP kinase [Verrucomicrobia bacterium GWF2_51_19]|nr:MAG: UMP kinase [Verrucomicrobia bacterium GWF2_51_19]HCJ11821.1 UMP kinase [Opitutae bacterium]